MKEYLMNTIVWLVNPIINKIDQFRIWTRRKEIVAERSRALRKRRADELCNELLGEYLIQLDRIEMPLWEYDMLVNSFTKKINLLYSKVQ